MTDDWFVPGLAIPGDAGTIRLRPPETWTRVEIMVPRVPPSMNDNKIRSNWRGFQREKKSWQEEIGMLLLLARVERGFYQRALAGAFMRFPRRATRDTGNYRSLLDKALGDALVISADTPRNLRYIPDDDAPHYCFGGVEFEGETGDAQTRILLYLQPPPQEET